jgi:hypothetical protein
MTGPGPRDGGDGLRPEAELSPELRRLVRRLKRGRIRSLRLTSAALTTLQEDEPAWSLVQRHLEARGIDVVTFG